MLTPPTLVGSAPHWPLGQGERRDGVPDGDLDPSYAPATTSKWGGE